jgi:hypothetical protein
MTLHYEIRKLYTVFRKLTASLLPFRWNDNQMKVTQLALLTIQRINRCPTTTRYISYREPTGT